MNLKINGEKNSQILLRHKKIQELIQQYPKSVGINIASFNSSVDDILQYTRKDINKLSAQECGEISVVLMHEAVYLQVKIGTMVSEINWCKKVIDRLIIDKIYEYGNQYTPFQHKRELAIKDNDIANELYGIMAQIELRLDIIRNLPNQLLELAKSYSFLQRSKET